MSALISSLVVLNGYYNHYQVLHHAHGARDTKLGVYNVCVFGSNNMVTLMSVCEINRIAFVTRAWPVSG